MLIQIFQNHIVDIRAQMADGSVQQVQIVLHAQLLELGAGGGVELGALAAETQVDPVHIAHQLQRPLLADVLVKRAAEIVGDIVFAVGKRTGAAKTAHNGAALAADAAFDLLAVDGAAALMERMTGFEHGDLQIGAALGQLIGGENTAGTGTDDDHIILHGKDLLG
jgi:hypothetical protein